VRVCFQRNDPAIDRESVRYRNHLEALSLLDKLRSQKESGLPLCLDEEEGLNYDDQPTHPKNLHKILTCQYEECQKKDRIIEKDKTHIVARCQDKCSVTFHGSCWNTFKGNLTTKYALGHPCATPDCSSTINFIQTKDGNENVRAEVKVEENLKKKNKSSNTKLSSSSNPQNYMDSETNDIQLIKGAQPNNPHVGAAEALSSDAVDSVTLEPPDWTLVPEDQLVRLEKKDDSGVKDIKRKKKKKKKSGNKSSPLSFNLFPDSSRASPEELEITLTEAQPETGASQWPHEVDNNNNIQQFEELTRIGLSRIIEHLLANQGITSIDDLALLVARWSDDMKTVLGYPDISLFLRNDARFEVSHIGQVLLVGYHQSSEDFSMDQKRTSWKSPSEDFDMSLMEDCTICLESLVEDLCFLPCGHKFHHNCIQQHRRNACPLCRAPLLEDFPPLLPRN